MHRPRTKDRVDTPWGYHRAWGSGLRLCFEFSGLVTMCIPLGYYLWVGARTPSNTCSLTGDGSRMFAVVCSTSSVFTNFGPRFV
jgi:hypothetical protein